MSEVCSGSEPPRPYAGTLLDQKKKFGGVVYTLQPMDTEQFLSVVFYEATNGMKMHVCYDKIVDSEVGAKGPGCASTTDPDRRHGSTEDRKLSVEQGAHIREWRRATFIIPPKTTKVFIGGHNEAPTLPGVDYSEPNYGVVGLGPVRLVKSDTDETGLCKGEPLMDVEKMQGRSAA